MKSVVLLSAGLDSTVNLYAAHKNSQVQLALTFDYGQRARHSEVRQAQKLARHLGVPHRVVALDFFKSFDSSSLISETQNLPVREQIQMDNLGQSQKTAKSVWVPNRNGIFLNIAAGFAESLFADVVVPGFNSEEAVTFPDNTTAFAEALNRSFEFSTANHIKVKCWTDKMDKTELVKYGVQLGVDFSMIWPCYQNLEKWCGECESCQRSRRALIAAEVNRVDWWLH